MLLKYAKPWQNYSNVEKIYFKCALTERSLLWNVNVIRTCRSMSLDTLWIPTNKTCRIILSTMRSKNILFYKPNETNIIIIYNSKINLDANSIFTKIVETNATL